jgi:hypothetical protein
MLAVIPEHVAVRTPNPAYDRHTAITATCAHGNHAKCGSLHRVHGGFHTCVIGSDGYPMQWPGGPLVAVHLTTAECAGCHCDCHRTGQLALDGAA